MKKKSYEDCPLEGVKAKEALSPKNREVAYVCQLHDDVRVLYALANNSPESFRRGLATIEAHIEAYRASNG